MKRLLEEIFLPVFSNKSNMPNWSDKSKNDIIDKLQGFIARTSETVGYVNGKTELPMPTKNYIESKSDTDKKGTLEGSVIMWQKQIKKILKLEPEVTFKTQVNPGPLSEINFWKSKAFNLN